MMQPIKLTQDGVQRIYKYCKNSDLFEIIDDKPNKQSFIIKRAGKNWFNKLFGLSCVGSVQKEEDEKDFYFHFDENLIIELEFDELINLLAVIVSARVWVKN